MDFLKQIFYSIAILLFSFSSLSGQEIIFPGLRGDSLTKMLVNYYTPATILPYDQARTKLYSIIDNHQDSVECFYSGYKIPIPQNTNVLSWTAKYGIQTEHLFPRSKGAASLPALGDLHHLVPAKSTINTLRNNSPFLEIPDNTTNYWILNDKILLKPIAKLLDQYSESQKAAFEPREAVKGDVARSILYFYTIYKSAADKKSKTFFTSMLPDLCAWSKLDKVDSLEYNRTMDIARLQGNINPFIFDPSLAERCYCAAFPDKPIKTYSINIYPNPSKGLFYIDIQDYKGTVILKISDFSGKLLETHHLMYSGLMNWRLGRGIFLLTFEMNNLQYCKMAMLVQ